MNVYHLENEWAVVLFTIAKKFLSYYDGSHRPKVK